MWSGEEAINRSVELAGMLHQSRVSRMWHDPERGVRKTAIDFDRVLQRNHVVVAADDERRTLHAMKSSVRNVRLKPVEHE